jgi:prephenate dehydratase
MTKPIIAFQGEHGAFSERAAKQHFGPDAVTLPCPSFQAVFETVENDPSSYGMIPVENSLGGSVHENFDLLREHKINIVGETNLRVVHHLIALPGVALEGIRRVYTHPQAAAQCVQFLRKHPDWVLYQVYDTAGAAKMIQDDHIADGAAIASKETATHFGMTVLASEIESHHRNVTRFFVIHRDPEVSEDANKVSLVYATKNQPGALMETLKVFHTHGVNLLKLESRPIPGRPWEYLFYVDLRGTLGQQVLVGLEQHTTAIRVLGSYPAAQPTDELKP